jgi:phosphoribosylanthranilate isomerase
MEGAGASTVAVVTSAEQGAVVRMAEELRPHAVQLNGPWNAGLVGALQGTGCEVWVAVHIGSRSPVLDTAALSQVDCVVLDTASPEGGGSGIVHDHRLSAQAARSLTKRVSLAGGLTAENVQQAIEMVRPDVVDVSSGVESKGVKDALKIERFIEKVRSCQ